MVKKYGVYSTEHEYEAEGLDEVRTIKKSMRDRGEKEIGHYEKENYWTHKLKKHPFDIRNNRNRKFPKLKHGYY